jgi:hypothetical protein
MIFVKFYILSMSTFKIETLSWAFFGFREKTASKQARSGAIAGRQDETAAEIRPGRLAGSWGS